MDDKASNIIMKRYAELRRAPANLPVEEVQELAGLQFAQKYLVLFYPSGSTLVLKAV